MYRINVEIGFENMEQWEKLNEAVEGLADCTGSGTAFRCRDFDFEVGSVKQGHELLRKITKKTDKLGLPIRTFRMQLKDMV